MIAAPIAKMTILIVEDDKFLQKILAMKFNQAGFDVRTASDGMEALVRMTELPMPALVVLDLILPKMNGFEVLTEIKKKPEFANVPIIVLSNLSQTEDVARVKRLGAADYFTKSALSIQEVVLKIMEAFAKFSKPTVGQ